MRNKKDTVKTRMAKAGKVVGLFSLFVMLFSVSAFAASLTLQAGTVAEDTQDFDLVVAFDASADEHVSALDFTLSYDNEKIAINSIDAAMNLEAAGKVLETNEDVLGTVKGIVYGLNNNDIVSGNLFTIACSKTVDAKAGTITISLSDVHGSTNAASAITISVVNGALVFEGEEVVEEPVDGLKAPTILNNDELINTSNFTLEWTDESASGATSYVVTRMQKPVSPLAISDGLVSYWPMNEASGAAIDMVGGNDLQVVGTVLGSSDRPLGFIPGSRRFGSDSYFELSNENATGLDFSETGEMSFSMWVKGDGGENKTVLTNSNGENAFCEIETLSTGAVSVSVSSDATTALVATSPDNFLNDNVWHHVAVVMSSGSGTDENPFVDSVNDYSVEVNGVVYSEDSSAKGKGSALFTGENTSLVFDSFDANSLFGGGQWTIDFWFNVDSLDAGLQTLFSNYMGGGKGVSLYLYNSSFILTTGTRDCFFGESQIEAGGWNHVGVVSNDGVCTLYVNGANVGSTVTALDISSSKSSLCLGLANGYYSLSGYLDEFRVSSSQRWVEDFDVASISYKNDDQTELLASFGVGNSVETYIDGVMVANTEEEQVVEAVPRVGFAVANGDGFIADLVVWGSCLSAEEVGALSFSSGVSSNSDVNSLDIDKLDDGNFLFIVSSLDVEGNASDYSNAYEVVIDTIAPMTPVISTIESLFNVTTIHLSGNCSSDTEHMTVASDTATINDVVLADTSWSAVVSVIDDGDHVVSVIAEDRAGNLSPTVSKMISVDTAAPIFSFVTPTETTYTVPRKTVIFNGSIDDHSVSEGLFRYVNSSGSSTITMPIVNGFFEFDYAMVRGLNECWFTVVDAAGNETVQAFSVTYANNLPLVFDSLNNKSVAIDEAVSFVVSITNQDYIDDELLTFSVSGLPCHNSSNPAEFDVATRQFSWVPNDQQAGLYTVTFSVSDGISEVSQAIKIVARDYDIGVIDLSQIVDLPQDKQVVVEDFDKDGHDDIYMVMQGANKLYFNNGNETFTENAVNSGVADSEGLGNCVIVFDINNDSWMDLYVVNDGANRLYRNNQDGSFVDVTFDYGVADDGIGRDAVFVDFDNDGDEDLYIVNDGKNSFYRNNNDGTFSEETDTAGFDAVATGINACVFDADDDGDSDIFVVNNGDNEFYINDGVGIFSNAQQSITGASSLSGYRGAVQDVDLDGVQDVYLVNTSRNIVYKSDGEGHLKAAVLNKQTLSDSVHSKSAFYIDYNDDGKLDLFIVDATSKYIEGMGNILFQNDGDGNYSDVTAIAGII